MSLEQFLSRLEEVDTSIPAWSILLLILGILWSSLRAPRRRHSGKSGWAYHIPQASRIPTKVMRARAVYLLATTPVPEKRFVPEAEREENRRRGKGARRLLTNGQPVEGSFQIGTFYPGLSAAVCVIAVVLGSLVFLSRASFRAPAWELATIAGITSVFCTGTLWIGSRTELYWELRVGALIFSEHELSPNEVEAIISEGARAPQTVGRPLSAPINGAVVYESKS